jgi:hypothetical protein
MAERPDKAGITEEERKLRREEEEVREREPAERAPDERHPPDGSSGKPTPPGNLEPRG